MLLPTWGPKEANDDGFFFSYELAQDGGVTHATSQSAHPLSPTALVEELLGHAEEAVRRPGATALVVSHSRPDPLQERTKIY